MSVTKERFTRPRLLLVYADSAHAAQCGRYFRRHGWEVRLAPNGAEARRMVAVWEPRAVVIDTELVDESGWLTCAKIHLENPHPAIFMLASQRSEDLEHQARCAGAQGVAARVEGVEALAELILGKQRLAQAV